MKKKQKEVVDNAVTDLESTQEKLQELLDELEEEDQEDDEDARSAIYDVIGLLTDSTRYLSDIEE